MNKVSERDGVLVSPVIHSAMTDTYGHRTAVESALKNVCKGRNLVRETVRGGIVYYMSDCSCGESRP